MAAAGVEWSCWRGPERDGSFPQETSWTWEWPEGGPKEMWRVEVGFGYSGVAVSEGRAYTVGQVGGDNVVWCLDAATGKEVWKKAYAQKVLDRYNRGGPNAAPVVEGKWLYVLSPHGLVSCLDKASGELRWRTDLAKEANARVPIWGFASAPLIVGERIFVNANLSGIALDKNTGKVIWASEREMCGYAAVVPIKCRGKDCVVVFGEDELQVVTQDKGEVVWKVEWKTKWGENSPDPLVMGERVYISSWWEMGAAVFEPSKEGSEPVWKNAEMQNHVAGPVLHEGCLFGIDGPVHRPKDPAVLRCVDAETGRTLWSKVGIKGSVILAKGKLIILTSEGSLVVADASREGYVERARKEGLGKRTWTPPTLHEGRIYVREADGEVVCLDLRGDGE
jgi:outer membrane protein assembly factor BamB